VKQSMLVSERVLKQMHTQPPTTVTQQSDTRQIDALLACQKLHL